MPGVGAGASAPAIGGSTSPSAVGGAVGTPNNSKDVRPGCGFTCEVEDGF